MRTDSKLAVVTNDMLVGRLRKALSYQFANEVLSRPERTLDCARKFRETRESKIGWNKNMKLLAEIPTREYFRITQEVDPYFFNDLTNIRKLTQECPHFKGGVGA